MNSTKKGGIRFKAVIFTAVLFTFVTVLFFKTALAEATSNFYYEEKLNKSVQTDTESELIKYSKQNLSLTRNNKKDIVKDENKPSKVVEEDNNTKVAYLTFDDGPSKNVTPAVLDVLKKENIKATFFVVGQAIEKNPELLKREKDEGHTIGNHTYSHNYNYIYSNTNNFLEDLIKNDILIKSVINNYNEKLIRFPAGSFGRQAYIKTVEEAGYNYVDWNCLNGDSEGEKRTVNQLVQRVKDTIKGQKKLTILMHDAIGKETTAEALPKIIEYLKSQGYEFKAF